MHNIFNKNKTELREEIKIYANSNKGFGVKERNMLEQTKTSRIRKMRNG